MKNSLIKKKIARCLCVGVTMQINGKLRHVINCHCKQCMKTHGNYATYTSCKQESIKFLSKRTLGWFSSSKIAKRGFCKKCGASIFFKRNNSKYISVSAGMFNNPTGLKAKMDIFIKGKLDYYALTNKLKKYHNYPFTQK